jgi:hypothetical protein
MVSSAAPPRWSEIFGAAELTSRVPARCLSAKCQDANFEFLLLPILASFA